MTTNIRVLTETFETAARNSLTHGQPPFAKILTLLATLTLEEQRDAMRVFARVWSNAKDSCHGAAALQFAALVDQNWFNRHHAALLMNVTRVIASNNERRGNAAAWRHMRLFARRDAVLISMIDQGVDDARKAAVVPQAPAQTAAKLRAA